jgi:hypothetical protein
MGSVPEGTYHAWFNVYTSPIQPYYAGQNTGWIDLGPVALSGSALSANLTWIHDAYNTYANDCSSGMAALGVSASCGAKALPWNGSYFGIVFTGNASDNKGNAYTSKTQLVFAAPGYTP